MSKTTRALGRVDVRLDEGVVIAYDIKGGGVLWMGTVEEVEQSATNDNDKKE